jgi:hypothetical protein
MHQTRQREDDFFNSTSAYTDLPNRGTSYLTQKLSTHLVNEIMRNLPSISQYIETKYVCCSAVAVVFECTCVHVCVCVCVCACVCVRLCKRLCGMHMRVCCICCVHVCLCVCMCVLFGLQYQLSCVSTHSLGVTCAQKHVQHEHKDMCGLPSMSLFLHAPPRPLNMRQSVCVCAPVVCVSIVCVRACVCACFAASLFRKEVHESSAHLACLP